MEGKKMIMGKYKPKNFKCKSCGKEQYTNDHCFQCNSKSFEKLEHLEEKELREKLRNTIEVMSLSQLKALDESLFG